WWATASTRRLMKSDPFDVAGAIELSRATLRTMSGSPAIVAVNALMLKRTKLAGIKLAEVQRITAEHVPA
ncbi:MAG TPA: hypothetical protein VF861_09355, partial [Telluria sp.]